MPRVLREYKRRSVLTASNCCKLLIILFLAGLSIQHTTSFLHADADYFSKEYVSNVAQDVANNVVNMVNTTRQYLRNPNNIDFNLGFPSSGAASEDDSNDEPDAPGSSDSSVDEEAEQKEAEQKEAEQKETEQKEKEQKEKEQKEKEQKEKEQKEKEQEEKEQKEKEQKEKEQEEKEQKETEEVQPVQGQDEEPAKQEPKEANEPVEEEKKDDQDKPKESTDSKEEAKEESTPEPKTQEEEQEPTKDKANKSTENDEQATTKKEEEKAEESQEKESKDEAKQQQQDEETSVKDTEVKAEKEEKEEKANADKKSDEKKGEETQPNSSKVSDQKKEEEPTQNDDEKTEKKKEKNESSKATDSDSDKPKNDDKAKQNDGETTDKKESSKGTDTEKSDNETKQNDGKTTDDKKEKKEEYNNKNVTDDQDLTDAMNSPSKTFYRAVTEATQLLYRDSSSLLQWVTQPLPRIYVYENIPDDWSDPWEVSNCVDHALGNDENDDKKVCSWQPQVCQDTAVPFNTTNTLRYNYNSDVGLLELFRKYPSRTDDPAKADLFVVPYPYWSHCLCSRTRKRFYKTPLDECPYDFSTMDKNIQLPHWTEKNKNRHLWILGVEWDLIKEDEFLNKLGVSLTVGAAPCKASNKVSPCPVIVHPYFSTGVGYQPNKLLTKSWWKKPLSERKYAVAAVHSTPDRLEYRKAFYDSKDEIGEEIGGKRVILDHIGTDLPQMTNVVQLYRSSIFCPILPGDHAVQRRFFDVILNGCIPVVPVWYRSRSAGWPSAHQKFGPSVSASYPYARGLPFFGDRDAGIDYVSDLMVTFNATCGMPCFRKEVEKVMANTTELQRLQENLQTYAPLFTYGLQDAAYSSMDAFAALIVSLRHYVMSL